MSHKNSEHEEIMVLDHEEVRGYRPVFLIAFIAGMLYLAYIFYQTL